MVCGKGIRLEELGYSLIPESRIFIPESRIFIPESRIPIPDSVFGKRGSALLSRKVRGLRLRGIGGSRIYVTQSRPLARMKG